MNESTFKIGLDIDGVVAEFEQHFLKYLRLPLHGAESWDDARFTDNFRLIKDDEHFWLTVPPILRGSQVMFNPEIYVTARPISTDITVKWLAAHNFPKAPVITVGHDKSKVDALKNKVDIFLDDAVHNFEELNEAGINCWIVTRNHNLTYDDGGRRFESLMDFQKKTKNGTDIRNYITSHDHTVVVGK